MYSFAPLKFYAGYENIKFANPETPLTAGFNVAALHARVREQQRLRPRKDPAGVLGGREVLGRSRIWI